METEDEDAAAWTLIEKPLAGLLGVEVDERHDISEPGEAAPWLVVRLHMIKGGGDAKIGTAMDAVARLHALAEGCALTRVKKTELWKRVLTSRMMVLPLRADDPTIWRFTRHLGVSSIQLLLDVTGMKMERILPGLRAFLAVVRPSQVSRAIIIGLRLTKCRLAADGIAALGALLTEAKAVGDTLVNTQLLGRLDLSDVGLTPDTITAVATLLHDHCVREVILENILARAATPDSVAAIRSLLETVLSSHSGPHATPLQLSLADNSMDARYYQAIAETLERATRPLHSLSLARTKTMSIINSHDREDCWHWLARLVHLASPNPQDAVRSHCELDLSGNTIYERDVASFITGIGSVFTEHTEPVGRMVSEGIPVMCRVCEPAKWFPTRDRRVNDAVELDSAALHTVEGLTEDGWLLLSESSEGSVERWVPAESIVEIRGGEFAVFFLPRFNALMIDDIRRVEADSAPMQLFLSAIGPSLRKLSMKRGRMISEIIPDVLRLCPRLTHLDVSGCRLLYGDELWNVIEQGGARELQSLNLGANKIGHAGVGIFVLATRAVPDFGLRHLVLAQAFIGLRGMRHLGVVLQGNSKLEVLELDGTMDNDDGSYAELRRHLTAAHDGELLSTTPLPLRSRHAFLWALAVLSVRHPALHAVDTPVASLILEFAGERVTRHLLWR